MSRCPRWLPFAASVVLTQAQAGEVLRNWFDDPFFQITAAVPDCPLPAGPFLTESDMHAQSHHRAEKGTSCWLEGTCDRPSAYAYDRDIASAFHAALEAGKTFANSSIWVTVQGRTVYVEGCTTDGSVVAEVEAFARSLPYVQQVVPIIRVGPKAVAPYRVRSNQ